MYPNKAPDGAVKPYITYSRVSVTPTTTLDKNDNAGNLVNTIMQVDVWATSYTEAQGKVEEIKSRLQGWNRQNVIRVEKDAYDPETQLHRLITEISIWHY